ncbi:MAG: trypsin-like peptidase domain-containing protein [Oscillospiraceae bacterium]|nr:trypsin-like peptidase domain-containing protein [Oscillospiraceae bacterium]
MYDNENLQNENRSRDSGNHSADGSYRYVRPESREMLYRDANIEPADEAARMPRYYIPPQKNTKEKPKNEAAPIQPNAAASVAGINMKGFWTKAICMCMICALLGGLVGGGITAMVLHKSTPAVIDSSEDDGSDASTDDTQSGAIVPVTPIPSDLKTPGEIYEDACHQVVGITTEIAYHNMFGMTVSQPVSGSGFFISDDGYVLTNYHVIEYAVAYGSPAKVITHDGTEYNATVVGSDADNDIAVLQVDATGLQYAALGNSDGIHVGDQVYAVGNPLGELQFSMTTGSISATNRLISTKDAAPAINMFQIDAAVNQGNSGGPVYNSTGEVIGIVTAKYSDEGIEGLGFAIPINDAVTIATDLITTGYVTGKAKLGVDAQTMSARAAMYYNSVEGAYIRYIQPGSCAEQAGLHLGDVIYRFGGLDVYSRDDLQAAVRSYHAGDTVELGVYRNQQHLTVMVTLDEDIPETVSQPTPGPVAYGRYNSSF